jgi:hypothetical protein
VKISRYLKIRQPTEKEYLMSNIYKVIDLTEAYGGEPAYGVEDTRQGVMVSIWTCHEMAEDIADELEYVA